jgi:hypothetical protein
LGRQSGNRRDGRRSDADQVAEAVQATRAEVLHVQFAHVGLPADHPRGERAAALAVRDRDAVGAGDAVVLLGQFGVAVLVRAVEGPGGDHPGTVVATRSVGLADGVLPRGNLGEAEEPSGVITEPVHGHVADVPQAGVLADRAEGASDAHGDSSCRGTADVLLPKKGTRLVQKGPPWKKSKDLYILA